MVRSFLKKVALSYLLLTGLLSKEGKIKFSRDLLGAHNAYKYSCRDREIKVDVDYGDPRECS